MSSIGMVALSLAAQAQPAVSLRDVREFDIPAGSLSHSLVLLGRQGGVSIGVFGQPIGTMRARRLKGRYSLAEALGLLLRGTGYGYRTLPGGQILVVRARAQVPRRAQPPSPPLPREAPKPDVIVDSSEIIVTGSKRGTLLSDYPAAVVVVDIDPRSGPVSLTDGSNAVADKTPSLASTYLGPGRDKVFIQGIADSSYNGYSTSTVAQYMGDVRLTYNLPDPHLTLYDVKRLEILQGPQATLYGAGAIGGIVRMIPNDPHSSRTEGSFALGLASTRHGASGGDAAAMINLPVVPDRIAIRAVGYREVRPGYIDDTSRQLRDINRVEVAGGRLAVRIESGNDWEVDLGGILQNIKARDSQYAVSSLPLLTQTADRSQPFGSDYRLGYLVIRKDIGDLKLVSATSITEGTSWEIFSGIDILNQTFSPSELRKTGATSIIANETRVSGRSGDIRFVGGVSYVNVESDHLYVSTTYPDGPLPIGDGSDIANQITDLAMFTEVEMPLAQTLNLTLGGRVQYARTERHQFDVSTYDGVSVKLNERRNSRTDFQVLPSAALAWRASPHLLVFARYQRGFRPGGFQPGFDTGANRPRLDPFPTDRIGSLQLGFRYGAYSGPLTANLTLFRTSWRNIRADTPTTVGAPSTTNAGDANIVGLEAGATVRPASGITIEGALFANKVQRSLPDLGRKLPSIPNFGASVSGSYRFPLFAGADLTVRALARHTGKSQSELTERAKPENLIVVQAASTLINLGARLGLGSYGITLDVTNAGDIRGNRFSTANPHNYTQMIQTTPFRPRTIRLGIDAAF